MLLLQSKMFTKCIRDGPLDLQWVQPYNKRSKKRIGKTTQVFNLLRNEEKINYAMLKVQNLLFLLIMKLLT